MAEPITSDLDDAALARAVEDNLHALFLAMVGATEMGLPVYQRMGFRDVGARINRYLWRR